MFLIFYFIYLIFISVKARRRRLTESVQQFGLFRECDDVESWIKEKVRISKRLNLLQNVAFESVITKKISELHNTSTVSTPENDTSVAQNVGYD